MDSLKEKLKRLNQLIDKIDEKNIIIKVINSMILVGGLKMRRLIEIDDEIAQSLKMSNFEEEKEKLIEEKKEILKGLKVWSEEVIQFMSNMN